MSHSELLTDQLTELRADHPDAALQDGDNGITVVTLRLGMPRGWSAPTSTVAFALPTPYPAAQPDCFYADEQLRLANGGMPANSGIQQLIGRSWLWFSWHLQQQWRPNEHTLRTYVRFVEERLRRAN